MKVLKLSLNKATDKVKESIGTVFSISYPHNDYHLAEFIIEDMIRRVGIDTVKRVVKRKENYRQA